MGGAELLLGAASFLPALGVPLEQQPAPIVQEPGVYRVAYLWSPFPSPLHWTKAELLQSRDDISASLNHRDWHLVGI